MRQRMHFPTTIRRRKSAVFKAAATRRRRFAVFELHGERERHLEQLFMAICSSDTDEMGKILRSRAFSSYSDASSDLLSCACATGNAESVQMLLENGIPFQSVGGKGDAPLHTAVRRGSLSIVRILLDFGADVNVETKYEHRTPLHLASVSRKLEVLQFLLENEADINRVDIYGSTALHLAADVGFSNGVSALLKFHSDPEVFNRDGWTALHLSAANGHLSVVEQLIEAHATIDSLNRFGRTPLHWACARGHLQVVKVLLKHKASTEVKDKNEKTAVDHASSKEIRDLIDAASSVTSPTVIPRFNAHINYFFGETTLRQTRASAFAEAYAIARGSSSFSSDSGISDNYATAEEPGYEERRRSFDGQTTQRDGLRRRRQRKQPIWSVPEGWRPTSAPVGAASESKLYRPLPKNEADGKLPAPTRRSGRSISTFGESFASHELCTIWPQADSPQRSNSEPSYLEKARELGMYLSPILEDDKTSSGNSLRDGDPTNSDDEPERSLRNGLRNPRMLKPRAELRTNSFEDDSSKSSREESSNESENDSKSDSPKSEYRDSNDLTRDLQKILERVSLTSDKDATFAGVASGLSSSQVSLEAMNSGLKQLLVHLESARRKDSDKTCSKA